MLNFDLTSNGQDIKFWVNGSQNIFSGALASGSYKYEFTTTVGGSAYFEATTNFVGTLDNISVVEVQGDRPRLSYDITNGVVEDTPHLLLEPSATNLVTFSENFTDWNGYQATSNSTTAPDGSSVLFLNFEDVRMFPTTTISSSTEYTASIYLKANKAAQVKVRNIRAADTAITLTTDWVRYEFTATSTGTSTNALLIDARFSQGLGATGLEIALFGAQIEAQSYATSYIPTAGTTITRAAETCNNSKPSVNSTEGVLYAETATLSNNTGAARILSLSDNTTNNSIRFEYQSTANQIRLRYRNGGASQNDFIHTLSNEEDFNKIAFKYKANDFSLYVNGTEVATDTSGSVVAANTFTTLKFLRGDDSNTFYGKVKGLAVYNKALSESQLMQLTGVTASSIYNNFVTRTASFTVEALNEVKKVIDNL